MGASVEGRELMRRLHEAAVLLGVTGSEDLAGLIRAVMQRVSTEGYESLSSVFSDSVFAGAGLEERQVIESVCQGRGMIEGLRLGVSDGQRLLLRVRGLGPRLVHRLGLAGVDSLEGLVGLISRGGLVEATGLDELTAECVTRNLGHFLRELGLGSGLQVVFSRQAIGFVHQCGSEGWGRSGASSSDIGSWCVRGDLHVHSWASDGRSSVADLLGFAEQLGHEYVAITDHTRADWSGRGMDVDETVAHVERLRSVANSGGRGVRCIVGMEVDILPDGRLDLPDEVLQELDYVVASIHLEFDQSAGELLARYSAAASNPNVDVIGHPTGRIIGQRSAMAFPMAGLVDIALGSDVALEINCTPRKMDLPEFCVSEAVTRGVALVVSTDAHETSDLKNIVQGVRFVAGLGVDATSVVNVRGYDEFVGWLCRRSRPRAIRLQRRH